VGLKTPRQGRYLLYTAPVAYRDDQHMTRTFLDIARAAGVRTTSYVPEPPAITRAEVDRVGEVLGAIDGPLVVVHVGSGDNFIGRRWPATSFARLTDRLVREHGVIPAFTGSPREAELVAGVIGMMEEGGHAKNLVGKIGLRELAALLDRADLLLANDTGPVHLASALGRPVLAFYGPNTPVLYGPLSARSHAFYNDLPCSPCITNMNYKTSFCRLPVCIENIRVDEVFAQATQILRGPAGVAG
jgi:ADP-heptose:LPS heptosyltransferase